MGVDRFLGASWASVHGPADPRRLLVWTLDSGFAGLWGGPAPRTLDWSAIRAQAQDLPLRFGGARVSAVATPAREAGLCSANAAERQAALALVGDAVEQARRLGSDTLILSPGIVEVRGDLTHTDLADPRAGWDADQARALLQRRDAELNRALDAACRSLFAACRAWPEMHFCLQNSRDVLGLGEVRALNAIFEDLSRFKLSYWHDAVAGHCRGSLLGEAPGEILESMSKHLAGMTLSDLGDGRVDLPPGAGAVDFPLLASYRRQPEKGFPVVVELDPGVEPGEIPGLHAFLDKFGL